MTRIVILVVSFALLSLVYAAAIFFKADDIEYNLQDRSNLALSMAGDENGWATVTIHGRDANLQGTPPDKESIERVEKIIISVWGIRMVNCQCPINEQVNSSPENVQLKPGDNSRSKPEPARVKSTIALNKTGQEKRSTLPPEKEKNSHQCQKDFDNLLTEHSIEFTSGSHSISASSYSLLDKLVAITQGCSYSLLRIAGHTDNVGRIEKNSTLSLERAEAVLAYFLKAGVQADRLKAVGYGSSSPLDSNATDQGRRRNRRIELHISP